MLRNLVDEVRNRRLLAFAALGVLVLLAVPLLFLKSAPEGAPSANAAAPAAAEAAKLPPRAARLLATTDPGAAGGQAKGSAQDPFAPPASYRAAADAAGAGAAGGGASSTTPAANAGGGAMKTTPVPSATNSSPSPSPSTSTATPPRRTVRSLNAVNASVDIRYGAEANTKIRRAIPRRKAFYIHGKLVAMFVKYSPGRKAAVFALAPNLHISGPVKCRVKDGSCRYLDIPAGAHAWITTITANRTIVRRRLDVVHIKRRSAGSSARTRATSASARSELACLARKLMAMKPGDSLIDRDACES